jgi:8-oxo-dGTP pyrophosphatase MutT (NUDIX family)
MRLMTRSYRLLQLIADLAKRVPLLGTVLHWGYRFVQPRYTIGVVGIVFNDEGKVLLVEHVFHPQYPWGLPGGWHEAGEQPYETALREIREELGLETALERLALVEITLPRHIDFAFLCRPLQPLAATTPLTLSPELLSYAWFDPDDTPPLVIFHRRALDHAVKLRTQP